jgi:serine/threonine protein phosphatase 1
MFMFSRSKPGQIKAARGHRAYVVGDVHGRLDLLDRLLDQIHDELDRRPAPKTLLVFVGDLIDRGPQSSEVIERLRTYRHDGVELICLLGNHEEVLLRILEGETAVIASWLSFGGKQTLKSYGFDPLLLTGKSDEDALQMIRDAIPPDHAAFLKTFIDTFRFGDYLIVHAGVRPGVELNAQRQSDLRWIREPFLADETDHGFMVVHGHTISPQVEERANRIGIDTGAYRTDVLTAVALEGADRWFLDTQAATDAAVSATH